MQWSEMDHVLMKKHSTMEEVHIRAVIVEFYQDDRIQVTKGNP